jgi:menaquinone-dependent protoporphyrinogen oxidase
MMKVLIAYGTSEGQTARIVECLADVIRSHGYEVHSADIKRSGAPELDGYDAVIVGASVHLGTHQGYVQQFVRKSRAALERVPTAFFSVSLAARDDTDKGREEVEGYIQRFVQQTGWRPRTIGRFAGALLYTRYGLITRWVMKKITRAKGSRDIDTSRDYVYTNWDSVKRFAEAFLETLVPESVASARG